MSEGHPQRLGLERTFPSELSACKKPRAPRASVSLGAPSAKGMGTPKQELRKSQEQPVLCSERRSPNVPQRHDLRPPPQKPPASARQSRSRHLQLQEGDLRAPGVAAGHPDDKRGDATAPN